MTVSQRIDYIEIVLAECLLGPHILLLAYDET